MIGVIAEHIKEHRHQLRKHTLFVGSSVKIPPDDKPIDKTIERMAIDWAGDRLDELEEEERPRAALEMMASEITNHAERCRMLQDELGEDIRPAEGHVRLARLIKDGYYSTVFIAEPDDLLERALRAQHMESGKDYHLLVAGVDDPEEIKVALEESSRISVVKCGGDVNQRFLPVTRDEIARVASGLGEMLTDTLKLFSVFVAMTEREDPFLSQVPREGARIFWINTLIPMADAALFDELKIENPASAEYHRYQPHVTELLDARHSSRHLLCREPGSFNEFFAKLHTRLSRRRKRTRGRRQDLMTVLRGGPYRFLDSFDVEDADFYFGREDDVKALMEMIQTAPITVVFGHPAIGKTSLLRAGLMAALRRETEEADKETTHPWLVAYTRVGEDPIASIRASILAAVEQAGYSAAQLGESEECCELILRASELTGRQIVVLLDQFAEYFVKLGGKVRDRFVEALTGTFAQCGDQFRLLIAIREDFVGELFELQTAFPEIMHNMHRLRALTREQAEDAIIKPAQNFELQIERSLVQRILDDLYRDGIEPVQLQIVLHSLYESLSPGGRMISERRYDLIGGAKETLDKYLERAINLLPGAEKRLATRLLVFVASGSELKASQPIDRIADEMSEDRDLVERILAHLVDLGLLRPVGRGRQREYELIHEVLADKIQSELAGRQVMLRDIQDLLTRELNNFAQFGLLMGREELKIIGSERDTLTVSPEELKLLIRSALTEQEDEEHWFGRVWELREEKADFIASLMRDAEPQVRLHTYEALGDHLEAKLIRHLVHGLDDDLPEVRGLAVTYLSQLNRHLLSMLENPDHRVRALAARALGHTADRRAVRALTEAFVDSAPALRDEVTAALLEIDDPRGPEMLLRSVVSSPREAWSAAYGLGRLSVAEDDLKALQKASNSYRKPELLYALGVALTYRRNFEAAIEAFGRAREASEPGYGVEAITEAEAQVEVLRERASAGEDVWPQFGREASHQSSTDQEVLPELDLAWQFDTRGSVMASPVVRDNTVYVGSRDERFYAIDTGKGTARWSFEASDRIEGAAAIAGDLVCFGTLNGTLYGLDAATGELRWERDLHAAIRSSCTVDDEALYLGTRAGQLVKIDPLQGTVIWEQRAAQEISSSPCVVDGHVVVGCWDGSICARKAENGGELWRHRTQAPVSSSPTAADGVVYCGSDDHGLYALDLETGGLLWRVDLGGQVRSSPALSAELVVVGSIDGNCYAVSRESGAIVWKAPSEEEIMSSPAISGSIVYVGSRDGALYAIALDSGEIIWKHKTAYGIYSSPAIAEQTVFIGFGYYGVAAFRPKPQALAKK